MKCKLHINDTYLFKQVAQVLGHAAALEAVILAYNSYNEGYLDILKEPAIWPFNWEDNLIMSFNWKMTKQGYEYWQSIDNKIEHKFIS